MLTQHVPGAPLLIYLLFYCYFIVIFIAIFIVIFIFLMFPVQLFRKQLFNQSAYTLSACAFGQGVWLVFISGGVMVPDYYNNFKLRVIAIPSMLRGLNQPRIMQMEQMVSPKWIKTSDSGNHIYYVHIHKISG